MPTMGIEIDGIKVHSLAEAELFEAQGFLAPDELKAVQEKFSDGNSKGTSFKDRLENLLKSVKESLSRAT